MNQRPTPETDSLHSGMLSACQESAIYGFMLEHARRLERQLAEAREELEDWRNAAKGAENPHPDEVHCTCVPLLHKLLKEAREAFVIATDQLVQAQMEIRRLRDIEP
jgi:hypothetical protein